MTTPPQKISLTILTLWAVGLLAIYVATAVAPWAVFIHVGPTTGLLTSIVVALPWIWAVQFQPAGIKLGPFAVPLIFNAGAVLTAWFLRL
ncbi:MAG: hypothetical protein HQL52_12085 [Magnetococcales bacterium]|nr:hypothetical protein [Magnetococcales bacterium]